MSDEIEKNISININARAISIAIHEEIKKTIKLGEYVTFKVLGQEETFCFWDLVEKMVESVEFANEETSFEILTMISSISYYEEKIKNIIAKKGNSK